MEPAARFAAEITNPSAASNPNTGVITPVRLGTRTQNCRGSIEKKGLSAARGTYPLGLLGASSARVAQGRQD